MKDIVPIIRQKNDNLKGFIASMLKLEETAVKEDIKRRTGN